jgi:nitronate monooxygenase
MVTTADEGSAAARAGVSVIVAQGSEAGGGLVGSVGGMVLIPAVVDAVAAAMAGGSSPPVVAAGGVADGRGLAAALTLGAEGVLVGTRFLATEEASVPPVWKTAICAARETDTVHTRVGNLVMRATWADVAPGRVLRTRAIEAWLGREPELAALPHSEREALAARWTQARADGRREDTEIIAGQDCGLIRELLPAAEVVRRIVIEAEEILGRFATDRRPIGRMT